MIRIPHLDLPAGENMTLHLTGGEFTKEITGRIMQGMKEFLTIGGSGDVGMFSLLEWIMNLRRGLRTSCVDRYRTGNRLIRQSGSSRALLRADMHI
ncbi:MAG: hypothetical protein U9N09_03730 [Euryarchaeota archaeon]|nr:hypothetical protein [Euryarchaeota archaeon]